VGHDWHDSLRASVVEQAYYLHLVPQYKMDSSAILKELSDRALSISTVKSISISECTLCMGGQLGCTEVSCVELERR